MSDEIKSESIPNERRKVFFGLFVFPMLIAVTMAVLLSSIVLLTHEEETPESLIAAIKTGSPSKRWQKAFELSNELNREGGMLRSSGIMNEIIHILNDKEHYDAKTRAYMAMALSRFRNVEAESALRVSLGQIDAAEDPQFALFLMWAIGNYQDPKAAVDIVPLLESEDKDLRKTAAYVLGALGNKKVVPDLKRLLEDQVADVQWNAALSLARLGDESGRRTLYQMLDRERLKSVHGLNEKEIERVMINAAKALGLISNQEAKTILEQVSKHDPSLKVKQAALGALKQS